MSKKINPLTALFEKYADFNYTCNACRLAHSDQEELPPIPGTFDVSKKKKLKLVVISDYPGQYETKCRYSMYDNTPEQDEDESKGKLPRRPNAGSMMRRLIEEVYGLDSYGEVYITNAIKCLPGLKTAKKEHVVLCKRTWFNKELEFLEKINPKVPFLMCGKMAFELLKLMIPHLAKEKRTMTNSRKKIFYYKEHPVVTTVNPAAVAKSEMFIERFDPMKSKKLVDYFPLPELPVSPLKIYKDDMALLKPFIKTS